MPQTLNEPTRTTILQSLREARLALQHEFDIQNGRYLSAGPDKRSACAERLQELGFAIAVVSIFIGRLCLPRIHKSPLVPPSLPEEEMTKGLKRCLKAIREGMFGRRCQRTFCRCEARLEAESRKPGQL